MKTIFIIIVTMAAWLGAAGGAPSARAEDDPPEVAIGERLFLETRFAQFFRAHATGVNAPLAAGDPVLDHTVTTAAPLSGPFAGASMNCRVCHMVDEQRRTPGGGERTYADFARRSPVPDRSDGTVATPRNAPSLVGAVPPGRSSRRLLHFDGEFASIADLAAGTLTGRNYGWRPDERELAVAHIARVVREDDGYGALAREFGGSYRRVLSAGPGVPPDLRLPPRFRIDVARASDERILRAVATLIGRYVASLELAHDLGGFIGSPFDRFLARNGLPRQLRPGQSARAYSRALRRALARRAPKLVPADAAHRFALHDHPFRFGSEELRGLRIFLREPSRRDPKRASGVGDCIACHPLPAFTDFVAHNTGVSQRAYDEAHGDGAFATLAVPSLGERNAEPDRFLPASPAHPAAAEPFRRFPRPGEPGLVDLGLWNLFQNPDVPGRRHQRRLARVVCGSMGRDACREARDDPSRLLDASIGLMKTPGLRDLGHSGPYLHDGTADTLEDVVRFYVSESARARAGAVRNAAPELAAIRLDADDVAPLVAFLRALDEDYE